MCYLEVQARLDFIRQHFRDRLVEGGDDFHGSLGLKTARVDEIIESIDERNSYAVRSGRC